jgi:hypothetical protein
MTIRELTFVAPRKIEFRERPRPVIDDPRQALVRPIASDIDRANEQLGGLRRLGSVLGVDPPPEPRASLWAKLAARCPDLLG